MGQNLFLLEPRKPLHPVPSIAKPSNHRHSPFAMCASRCSITLSKNSCELSSRNTCVHTRQCHQPSAGSVTLLRGSGVGKGTAKWASTNASRSFIFCQPRLPVLMSCHEQSGRCSGGNRSSRLLTRKWCGPNSSIANPARVSLLASCLPFTNPPNGLPSSVVVSVKYNPCVASGDDLSSLTKCRI